MERTLGPGEGAVIAGFGDGGAMLFVASRLCTLVGSTATDGAVIGG